MKPSKLLKPPNFIHFKTMSIETSQVQSPVVPGQTVVLTRQTATGFEQTIAAVVGLFTAGPLGALASWGTIRGTQGKWAPWAMLGCVGAPVLGLVQLGILTAAANAAPVEEFRGYEQIEEVRYLDYSQAASVAEVDVPSAFSHF